MTIYCDRLDLRAALTLLRRRPSRVLVLDPIRGASAAQGVLRAAGIAVEEARFFAGHLRTPEGEAVYVVARRLTTTLAFDAADRLIAESGALQTADRVAGRGTLRLFLARTMWRDLEPAVMRILIARALAGEARCTVALQSPLTYHADVLRVAFPETSLVFHGRRSGILRRPRLMFAAVVGSLGRELRWMLPWRRAAAPPAKANRPGLLLIQEDDISMDRSHRSQPHWLLPGSSRPQFDIFVMPQGRAHRAAADDEALKASGVQVLTDAEMEATRRAAAPSATDTLLTRTARSTALAALTAPSTRLAVALASTWGLLVKARSLASWCAHWNIRAYLTGENYPVQSDAMQIVAEHARVPTFSYQYSNLAFATPLMMTTADRLVLFSQKFAPLWTAHGVRPGAIEEAGYVFDGAFPLVRARAEELRRTIAEAGGKYVLCYFDESVQSDKFGLISDNDHREELRDLAQALLDDPTLGLVVKTQFERNSPSRRYAGDPVFEKALATGRYAELRHGVHRNTVFPAEAALAADFCIGHIVGATAALEAALTGRRCALLNPYGMRSFADDLYAQVNVVATSIGELLERVANLRAGDRQMATFGDWTPILPSMDPFRDGRSAERLRAILDEVICGAAVRTGAA